MKPGEPRRPRLLVLYPDAIPHYVDREFLLLLRGYENTWVVPESGEVRSFRTPPDQVRTERYRRTPGLAPFDRAIASSIPTLDVVIGEVEPSVVVTYEIFSALSHAVARSFLRRSFRHVVVCYESTSVRGGGWGHYPLTRRWAGEIVASADLLLAHTDRTREALGSSGAPPDRVWMNPPGVYIRESAPPHAPPESSSELQVLFVGGMRQNKGVPTLLKAIERLRGLPVRFLLVGSGPLERRARRAAIRDPRIQVLGRLAEGEKQKRLDEADLFVYPSEDIRFGPWIRWEEQTATSVLEAMEAGLAVLGTDSGALPEIVGDPSMVVPEHDPTGLAERLRELLLQPAELRRRGVACRQRAVERFNLEVCARNAGIEFSRRWPEQNSEVPAAGARSPPEISASGSHSMGSSASSRAEHR
jgi:glycosyltransferase involved in cell wall biosynthesis